MWLFETYPGLITRLVLLCALLFLSGRAMLELLLSLIRIPDTSFLKDKNYLALAMGSVTVLLATWLLTVLHAYGYVTVLSSLITLIAVAVFVSSSFRVFLRAPWRELDWTAAAYAAGSLMFWLLLNPAEFPAPFIGESIIYLAQGFNLFLNSVAAEYPVYGVSYVAPVLYSGHLISATFGMLSFGSHDLYYAFGVYWLNFLIAPAIPVGAYLFFRRFTTLIPALLLAGFFCTVTLDVKIWSLRGEPIGWILAFACVLSYLDFLGALRERNRSAWRLFPILGFLLFGLALTHGVGLAIAAFMIIGLSIRTMLAARSRATFAEGLKFGLLTCAFTGLLIALLSPSYARTSSMIESTAQPAAGLPDASYQLDNAWRDLPPNLNAPLVHERPPYASPIHIAKVAAFLPIASLFRPDYATVPSQMFPGEAFERIDAIPRWEKAGYVLLMLLALAFYASPLRRRANPRLAALFSLSLTVYVASVLSIVYLDYRSVWLYPLAGGRRSFVYIEAFYWIAIATAAIDFTGIILKPKFKMQLMRIASYGEGWLVPVFVATWFFISINGAMGRPISAAWFAHRLAVEVEQTFTRTTSPVAEHLEVLTPMFDAMKFVRDHTKRNDRVYINIVSPENTFAFLTNGRVSLLEGISIAQLFYLQRAGTERIEAFRQFGLSADPAIIQPYDAKFAVIYKPDKPGVCDERCYGAIVLPTNEFLFEHNPAYNQVFSNSLFDIYQLTGQAVPTDRRVIGTNFPTCTNSYATPAARAAACDRALPSLERVDRASLLIALDTAGDSYANLNQLSDANERYTQVLSIAPNDAHALIGRAWIRMREGQYGGVLADADEAVRIEPRSPRLRIQRGLIQMQLKHFNEASADFSRATELAPENTDAYYQLGLANLANKHVISAIADFLTIASHSSDDHDPIAIGARAQLRTLQQNAPAYNEIEKLSPICASNNTSPSPRVAACSRLLELDRSLDPGKDPSLFLNRGLAYAEAHDLRSAVADFKTALSSNPRMLQAALGLGQAHQRLGEVSLALDDYGQAIDNDDSATDAYYLRAVALFAEGHARAALRDLDSVVRIDPSYGGAYYQRARVDFALGRNAQAAADYKRSVALNPKFGAPELNPGVTP